MHQFRATFLDPIMKKASEIPGPHESVIISYMNCKKKSNHISLSKRSFNEIKTDNQSPGVGSYESPS